MSKQIACWHRNVWEFLVYSLSKWQYWVTGTSERSASLYTLYFEKNDVLTGVRQGSRIFTHRVSHLSVSHRNQLTVLHNIIANTCTCTNASTILTSKQSSSPKSSDMESVSECRSYELESESESVWGTEGCSSSQDTRLSTLGVSIVPGYTSLAEKQRNRNK
jgi:hypothetical protein